VTIEGSAFSVETARNLVTLKISQAPGGYPATQGHYHQNEIQQSW
jgi:hypothetical protein